MPWLFRPRIGPFVYRPRQRRAHPAPPRHPRPRTRTVRGIIRDWNADGHGASFVIAATEVGLQGVAVGVTMAAPLPAALEGLHEDAMVEAVITTGWPRRLKSLRHLHEREAAA